MAVYLENAIALVSEMEMFQIGINLKLQNSFSFAGDYENSGKTLQAVCEVAIEACQNYFSQENKK